MSITIQEGSKTVATYTTSQGVISVDGFDRNVVIATAVGDIPKGSAVAQVGRKYDNDKPWAGTVLAGFWCIETTRALVREVSTNGALKDQPLVDAILAAMTTDLTPAERLLAARAQLSDHPDALARAVRVGTYGARKYERDNWLHVDDGINRYYEAAGRHVLQILEGKWIDTPDDEDDGGSGLENLDHICWCIFAGAKLADTAKVVK